VKVLFVEASSGQVVGGSLTGLLTLIDGIDRAQVDPVLVLYEEKPISRDLRLKGIPVRIFSKRRLPKEHPLQTSPTYKKAKDWPGVTPLLKNLRAMITFLFETLPAGLRLARIVREEAPDIIHACNGFRGNMDAIVAARICGVPCIVHCKGFDKHTVVERLLSRRVATTICMTRAIENHCREQRIRSPEYHVVYDGLDLKKFRPTRSASDVREELGIEADAPVVGVVGHIQEWKGQSVLVEAMSRVVRRYPQAVALIVGGAHKNGRAYAESLRRHVLDAGLERSVIFTGARDDVADVMGSMDVVAHTSVLPEPFGRVVIEAMAVGRPVIATRGGGVPEFVTDGVDGLLVTAGDADELADALCRLFGDASMRRMLAEGARKSVERFDVQYHVRTVTGIYRHVLGGAGVRADGGEPETAAVGS